jgi:diguanylate cyclase (GGDEF)-like protein/PAS domain S-box-containing protein
MFGADSHKNYRAILVTAGIPLFATAAQWLLWPLIKPFSWFIYWPTISICILIGNFKQGIWAILLCSLCAWWFFVPEPLSWVKNSPIAYVTCLIFVVVNIAGSYIYNRLKKQSEISEQKLVNINNTHALLLDSLVDGVFVAQGHKFVFANRAFPAMLGYSQSEFVNKPFSYVIAPEFLALWTSRFEQRISGGVQPERCYEVQFVHKNGHYLWIELRAGLSSYHGLPAVLGIVRDITQRKKQERKLHLADMVFQKTQEGIAITDAQRNILLSNPAFSVITEYNAEELLGVDIRSLYAEDKNSAVIREKQQSLKDAGLWQGALWKRRKSGEVYREWVVINAIYNEAGEIVQYIDISLDVSRIDHVETHMEYLAHHDALTDLPNRLLLHSRLEHTLELAKRNNEKCALMFMDLDSFKFINDTYGHAAGDEMLKIVSQRMKAKVRDTDTLARLAGDEFVIILSAVHHKNDITAMAKAIVDNMSEPCTLSDGTIIKTGVSIGISIYPDDGLQADVLLDFGDKALYRAKKDGRGRWKFFNEGDNDLKNLKRGHTDLIH